ncbi:MAG TPA: LamG-like jellyroll fold domain-containing protein, partial [Parafilimonas sp.]
MKSWLCLITLFFIFPRVFSQNCNNWAKIDSSFWIQVGDLNVTGDQLTVEAMFNKTHSNSGSLTYSADLVSKHLDTNYASYALRPNSAEITTKDSNYETPAACNAQLNKTYHVAMVYDGRELKFYRNGFLMSKIACTGTLRYGKYLTDIGFFSKQLEKTNGNFIGYINEVRIWNVARSQDDIIKYMNKSLPNPTSQTGLLAYYTFDDLKNKQGNPQWDCSVTGIAQINQTNPECKFIADSCQLVICNLKAGFTYQKNVCDTKAIQFTDTTLYADSTWWDFGNGQTDTALNPIVQYADYGQYVVHLYTATNAGCKDTATDTINVSVQKDNAIITGDTAICAGSSVQLNAISGLNYCWSPATTLSDSSVQNPVATPTATTMYYLNVLVSNDTPVIQDSIKITVLPIPTIQTNN